MNRPRLYRIPGKWGDFVCGFTESGLSRFSLPSRKKSKLPILKPGDEKESAKLLKQLKEYLAARPVRFTVKLDLSAVTTFRRKVLRRMYQIPHGKLMTYGEMARAVGSPGAARAVGGACGANPAALVNPCHRVVASGGIGGFGSGLGWKRRLLSHEGVDLKELEG